ncbi:MAG: hypothetical protein CMI16_09425 [Opitutaceae bacterium]|jgi:hypothetical protein|nr:hypothetical protein [Opitutaceae bacterium]|tara:strand:- start:2362 stop:2541 length:180 start_codon:yes stop_codon:yes gene_type:complete
MSWAIPGGIVALLIGVAYYLWNGLEEGMEMAGVLIFLRAVLQSMKGHAPSLPLTFTLTD